MSGEDRRAAILRLLSKSILPGSMLAKQLSVSRQIIVQDIALLRSAGYEIISSRQGYILSESAKRTRAFHVRQDEDALRDELNIFVDAGGTVQDVFVIHNTYGMIRAELHLSSRREVNAFLDSINSGREAALKGLCKGGHWHTVTADSEDILDGIESELEKHGFLVGK
jgi:transcriptional regulator of NAD metabolism